ncbi:MAG TPA: hypothetical protein PK710_24310, partial [Polyangiaceae bacterium]|nr:hypothetical protein [Polyangiaceae bacterium]
MGRKLAASLIAVLFMGCTIHAQTGSPQEPAQPAPPPPPPPPAATENPAEPAPAPATPTTSGVKQEGGKLKMPG